jgi:hypothetical protein
VDSIPNLNKINEDCALSRVVSSESCELSQDRFLAGNPNDKLGSLSQLGKAIQLTVMSFGDDLITDRQSQPGAFADRFGGVERVKNVLPDRFANAYAIIGDRDLYPVVMMSGGDADAAGLGALFDRVDRVAQQV